MSTQMAHSKPQGHLAGDPAIAIVKKAIMGGQIIFRRDK
jgi:hypothetical protein